MLLNVADGQDITIGTPGTDEEWITVGPKKNRHAEQVKSRVNDATNGKGLRMNGERGEHGMNFGENSDSLVLF